MMPDVRVYARYRALVALMHEAQATFMGFCALHEEDMWEALFLQWCSRYLRQLYKRSWGDKSKSFGLTCNKKDKRNIR